jgi:hypothetical protein
MGLPGATKTLKLRTISALALLFVFFLPFHFHFSLAAKITKECSCLQGDRSQLAPIASDPPIAPQFRSFRVANLLCSVWTEEQSSQQYVRGPPSL